MLTQMSPLLYWYTFPNGQVDAPTTGERVQALEHSGVQASALHDLMAVYSLAAEQFTNANRTIFVLQGDAHQVFAGLSRLRSINQQIGVILLTPVLDENFIIQVMHGGADGYALGNASDSLILALVNNVWRRLNTLTQLEAQNENPWSFTAKGWVLMSPRGERIDLTTTERQLLDTLFSQPGRRADHRTLLNALEDGESTSLSSGQNRLGVIISRLKKKASTLGIELPLRSVHRWGYMFAAEVYVDNDEADSSQ